jgi:hypothetical protein
VLVGLPLCHGLSPGRRSRLHWCPLRQGILRPRRRSPRSSCANGDPHRARQVRGCELAEGDAASARAPSAIALRPRRALAPLPPPPPAPISRTFTICAPACLDQVPDDEKTWMFGVAAGRGLWSRRRRLPPDTDHACWNSYSDRVLWNVATHNSVGADDGARSNTDSF